MLGSAHDQAVVRRTTLAWVDLASIQTSDHVAWTLSRWVGILSLVMRLVVRICSSRVVVCMIGSLSVAVLSRSWGHYHVLDIVVDG